MVKSKITRIISMASAVACMTACINFAPADISEAEAVEVKTAFEITEDMGLGWNLGNSFDSYNSNVDKLDANSETTWGNPVTTNEMLDAVKSKGFNTIRVPVTWFQHVDENYKIDEAWLARVKEVVDHCYDNGMYVILNLHHEEPYQNRSTLGADYEEISEYVTTVWEQLADTFKDYDQHLIFETMNEPRATGTDHEWWGPTDDEVDTINKINEDALNVIRKAGGQNDTRLVMMPGYCASSDTSMMSKVIIPDDDFVAASVHAYSPYNFAMDDTYTGHDTFTEANRTELVNIMDGIRKTFSDKDIPVVLGEFSASNFGNTEARCDWAEAYISVTKAYGFPCVLWDNNVEANNGGEAHGYLKRSDCTWYTASEPVVDTMVKVINDDSIAWGSERKSPVITHDDITTGKQLIDKTYDLDASVKDGNCTEGLNATWKDLEGGDVAIKYTGEAPVIAVVDGEWQNWTEIKPYDDADGIAYYSSEHIKSAWSGDVSEIEHIFARTNGKTTVEAMAIIGAGDISGVEPEPEVPIYTADLTKTDGKTLTFTITGKAGSTVNGCVGYMADEWEQIEWADKIGADGTVTVTVDTSTIPSSISSAQVQIWWCDDKEAEVTIKYDGETPAETTTAPVVTTAPTETTTVAVPTGLICGDVNSDHVVDLADAVAIIQHIGNEDKYGLSETSLKAADTNADGKVTGADAIIIQHIEAGTYTAADLPIKAS